MIKVSGKAVSLLPFENIYRVALSGPMGIVLVSVQPPNSVPVPLPALRTMRKTDQQAIAGLFWE